MAEWLRTGLQIRLSRFDSGWRLQLTTLHFCRVVFLFGFHPELEAGLD